MQDLVGIGYASIDKKISELLGIGEENGHELEIEFSDMSELKKYLKSHKTYSINALWRTYENITMLLLKLALR